jgi:hypothetical protein
MPTLIEVSCCQWFSSENDANSNNDLTFFPVSPEVNPKRAYVVAALSGTTTFLRGDNAGLSVLATESSEEKYASLSSLVTNKRFGNLLVVGFNASLSNQIKLVGLLL